MFQKVFKECKACCGGNLCSQIIPVSNCSWKKGIRVIVTDAFYMFQIVLRAPGDDAGMNRLQSVSIGC